jgi:hypothetical protein
MVNVVDDIGQGGDVFVVDAVIPVELEHPTVESDADDATPFDDGAELIVAELALVGDKRAAVVVAGEDRSEVHVEGLPEGLIG